MAQCTAKSKRSGERCRREATPGAKVCASHGSKSLKGVQSPSFKTGAYSKAPERLLANFQAALQDPELLGLHEDIAMIDARIADLMARVDSGESGALWKELREVQRRVDTAHKWGDNVAVAEGLNQIRTLINRGYADHAIWAEVDRLWERKRRLAETERKRQVDMHQMIQGDQVLATFRHILDVVDRKVPDRKVAAEIFTAVRLAMTAGEAA